MPISDKTPVAPGIYDKDQNLRAYILNGLNKVKIGTVQSFNSVKRTVTVQLSFKKLLLDGTLASYRPLADCPVFTLQGGGKGFIAPIAQGDECLVLFSDQSIDTWFEEGGSELPASIRVHDLSDGIALVGLNSLVNPIAFALEMGEVGFSDGTAKVAINEGLVTLANGTTTLLTLMVNFITLLETLTVLDDEGSAILPLTPAFIALLEAYKAQFETLLY